MAWLLSEKTHFFIFVNHLFSERNFDEKFFRFIKSLIARHQTFDAVVSSI